MSMLDKEKISQRQFTVLVMMFIIGSSILISPSGLALEAKHDAWIAVIFSVAIGLSLVFLYVSLSNRYSNMTLAQYSELIIGKWAGKFLSLLYFFYFFILSALVLRNLGDFLKVYDLPNTPIEAIHILFLLVVVMAIRLRLEAFARATEIFFPVVMIIAFTVILFIAPQSDVTNIQPVLEEGFKPIIRASIPFMGTPLLELVVFLMILPSINQTTGKKMVFLKGYFLGGGLLIIFSILTILVLGDDLTGRKLFPTYDLAKQINVGNFLQRLESLVAVLWFITIFIKTTICFYAMVLCLSQSLNIKDYRILVYPLSMPIIILSLTAYPNTAYFMTVVGSTWPYLALVFGFIFPVVLLIISFIREKTEDMT